MVIIRFDREGGVKMKKKIKKKGRPNFFQQVHYAEDQIAKYSKMKTPKARSLLEFYRKAKTMLLMEASEEQITAMHMYDQDNF